MDEDDARPAAPLLKQLMAQDLDPLSQEELRDRIEVLKREINRTQEAIESKQSSRLSAEKFFR